MWARPALIVLLLATAVLYGWGLGASGWANSFYAAAAQAGSASWKAWFFGSFDASNFITVDKTPAALWVSGLSVRIFGLSPLSVLAPQALEGVATVALLYSAVRRWFGAGAALLSGVVLAVTPVAALMFRFNNPDALLTLALVAGAYGVIRALEHARTGWLVLAGACVGLGFLAKMLEAVLVVPAFAIAFLVFAPTPVRRRIRQVLVAGAAMVGSAAWWVAVVELTPARYRPYVGGSSDNDVLQLALGYNGFGRLTGNETAGLGVPRIGWGEPGWGRMFSAAVGGQVAWLLPAALVLGVAGFAWVAARGGASARAHQQRAAFVLWGVWLVVAALVFSFMAGIFHPYYTLALAPAVAALVGMGAGTLWRRRSDARATALLAAVVAGTAVWSYVLLDRSPRFEPWLRGTVLLTGLLAAALVLFTRRPGTLRTVRVAAATGAMIAVLAGPAAYSLQTASVPRSGGADTAAGPEVPAARHGPMWGGAADGFGAVTGARGSRPAWLVLNRQLSQPSPQVLALLKRDDDSYRWVVAAVGSRTAATYQLSTGRPAMAVGGFSGRDPTPTLAQFQQDVAAKEIHYFVAGGPLGSDVSRARTGDSAQIANWIQRHYTPTTIDGVTIYDLSG
ncbi:ArnT family glycosyltransferase [Dactylosporangium siamense]|uniref:Glycosyl transferase n=1 Tax=Dactylosporangium siamense TaxID=685454 RepID=A0A919PZH5_9ACTN|nr:glycosyltransferase family 39 protein [Dactylosporangium siamense]GIG52934.1 glycosyl transferase [Dactylosporangium siamense]